MKNPTLLGCVAILYGAVLFFFTGSMESARVALYLFVTPFLTWLPFALVASYVVGGVGLSLRRAWASLVVLVAAIVQLALCVVVIALLYSIDGNAWGALRFGSSVAESLVVLLPPTPLAYVALRLRRDSSAWTSSGQRVGEATQKRRLYEHRAFWGVVLLGAGLVWIGSLSPPRRVSVDGLRLCYPAEYALRTDLVESLIALVRGTYADVSSEVMHIPDQLLAERVSGFEYDVSDTFVLYGAAYSRTMFDSITPAERVWRIRARSDPWHRIEEDPELEMYRIYDTPQRNSWYLVSSPPPEIPESGPPRGWYVGHCVGYDRCKVDFCYDDIVYVHAIQQRNLHLRHEIGVAVREALEEWRSNCMNDLADR